MVITIGLRDFQLNYIISCLMDSEYYDIAEKLIDSDYENYDIALYPEKGDALDHIDETTEAVIAVHLFGIHSRTLKSLELNYFYNKRNWELRAVTKHLGIPLIVFGDQPTGEKLKSRECFRVY